jgi:hypothetical protein
LSTSPGQAEEVAQRRDYDPGDEEGDRQSPPAWLSSTCSRTRPSKSSWMCASSMLHWRNTALDPQATAACPRQFVEVRPSRPNGMRNDDGPQRTRANWAKRWSRTAVPTCEDTRQTRRDSSSLSVVAMKGASTTAPSPLGWPSPGASRGRRLMRCLSPSHVLAVPRHAGSYRSPGSDGCGVGRRLVRYSLVRTAWLYQLL